MNDAPSCDSSTYKIENIKRCLECNKIPLIEINEKDNIFYINYFCENGHKGEITLDKFLKNQKNTLNKIPCAGCNKKQENNFLIFYYCITCKQILCNNCFIKHSLNQDQIILLSRYDSTCFEHNQSFSYYCKICKKNICMLCLNNHKNHNVILLSDEILSDDYLEKLKNKIKNLDSLKKYKNEIIEELQKKIKLIEEVYSKYEKNYNLQNSLVNNLIDSYIFEKKLNNYNFEVVQNLKNIEKIRLPFPDFSLCKNIFEKTETFISFYKKDENNVKKQENKISFSKDNFQNKNKFQILESKILNKLVKHKSAVNHIILLEDGRIASSSNDNTILIYNKDNNKIELKIENKEYIFYIIQAVNGYIIASETTGSILIYKLTSLTSYELIQKIKAHNGYVRKTIEIEDRRLISCSDDKTIKIWKFNNNQYILENTLNQYNKTEINSVIEINDDTIVSTPFGIGSVVFWNIKELKIVSEIKQIDCIWCWNILKKISNDFFLVGGKSYIYLFSIINYNLINKFEIDSICYSICYLLDGSILTGHQNGNIKQYNLINNELKLIGEKKYHQNEIRVITQLKNNLILSGSSDSTINIYKIE